MPVRAWLSKIRKRPGVYGDRLSSSDVLIRYRNAMSALRPFIPCAFNRSVQHRL